jgi:hypothetical protein
MMHIPVSQNSHKIVCLANSRKHNDRCVAGKIYESGQVLGWVRPISARQSEELSVSERQYENGAEPQLLDVLEFSFFEPKPSGHQSENIVISGPRRFRKIGNLSPLDLIKSVDKPINLWIMGYESRTYGKNDLVPPDRISEVKNSLYLINPHNFSVQIVSSRFGRQTRGRFSYLGADYNLKITDPVLEFHFRSKPDGDYSIRDTLLTISLAHDLHTVSKSPQSTGYYKVIAGVIDISHLERK